MGLYNISLSDPQMQWEVTHRMPFCDAQDKDGWMNPMGGHKRAENLSVGQGTGHTSAGHHTELDGGNP